MSDDKPREFDLMYSELARGYTIEPHNKNRHPGENAVHVIEYSAVECLERERNTLVELREHFLKEIARLTIERDGARAAIEGRDKIHAEHIEKYESERVKKLDEYIKDRNIQAGIIHKFKREYEGLKTELVTANKEIARWQSEKAELKAELERAKKALYVSGLFECPKCKLVLASNTLNVNSGNISGNNEPQECANNCGPMWRVSWKNWAEESIARHEKSEEKLIELRAHCEVLASEMEGCTDCDYSEALKKYKEFKNDKA